MIELSAHDVFQEYPSSDTLKIPIIRYAQNTHHQIRSKYPSSDTLKIPIIAYLMMGILSVSDDGYFERI
jgi:hypothetical protein